MRCEQKKSSSGTVPIQITNKRVFTCNFHDLICSRNVREFSILHQFFELTLNNPKLSNLNNGNPFLFPILLNCPIYIKKVRFNIGLNILNIIKWSCWLGYYQLLFWVSTIYQVNVQSFQTKKTSILSDIWESGKRKFIFSKCWSRILYPR